MVLYETWWDKSRSEEPDPETMLRTCTIITTNAEADMVDVHDRMPVIIERPDFDRWLDPDQHDTEVLSKLLLPAPKGTLVRHPVDKAVNSPRNDGPQLLTPVEPVPSGVLQLEVQIVHQKADVHVGHGNLELFRKLFLDRGKVVARGDPLGNGVFLLRRESHGKGRLTMDDLRFLAAGQRR